MRYPSIGPSNADSALANELAPEITALLHPFCLSKALRKKPVPWKLDTVINPITKLPNNARIQP